MNKLLSLLITFLTMNKRLKKCFINEWLFHRIEYITIFKTILKKLNKIYIPLLIMI